MWIRIRIQPTKTNADTDPGGQNRQNRLPKKEKVKKISCFELLDVLF
jgi:hypothetical protein